MSSRNLAASPIPPGTARAARYLGAVLLCGAIFSPSAQESDPLMPPAASGVSTNTHTLIMHQHYREARDVEGNLVERWYMRAEKWWMGEVVQCWLVRDPGPAEGVPGLAIMEKTGVFFLGPGAIDPVRDPLLNIDCIHLEWRDEHGRIIASPGDGAGLDQLWALDSVNVWHRVLP